MARHFLGLYLLIIVTLAVVSWSQDRLLQAYSGAESGDGRAIAVAMISMADRLHDLPSAERRQQIAAIAARSGVPMELFASADLTGAEMLAKLQRGEIAYMRSSNGDSWALKRIDADAVLAARSFAGSSGRSPLEWALTLLFYAAIALVLMVWIWPLTRDLRALERSAARYGDRNWSFDLGIKPHSQIHPLAQTFRRMAARIDRLIASHKDLSNALSHEIRTPLTRMQFEIELAQQTGDIAELHGSLLRIKSDITAIDALVRATLDYAILERAEVSLNFDRHPFSTLLPAIAERIAADAPDHLRIQIRVAPQAREVLCDVYLMETVLKNLLYNAIKYARSRISVDFQVSEGRNQLWVDDDGPGIPEPDRERVFESFVRLERSGTRKSGFGLGLAIVKRITEWHHGEVVVASSPLGGARVGVSWPVSQPANGQAGFK